MIGFISEQTKWYNDKATKLQYVTKELKALDPQRKKKQAIALRILEVTTNAVVAINELAKAYSSLQKPMQHFSDAAGYVMGYKNRESEFVFNKRKDYYKSIIPSDTMNKYSEIEKLIKEVEARNGNTRN